MFQTRSLYHGLVPPECETYNKGRQLYQSWAAVADQLANNLRYRNRTYELFVACPLIFIQILSREIEAKKDECILMAES